MIEAIAGGLAVVGFRDAPAGESFEGGLSDAFELELHEGVARRGMRLEGWAG